MEIADFKRRLRALRKRFAVTQQQVADAAGLDYKFYQYIESPRKKQVWLDTINRLAAVYRLETWEFCHPDFLKFAKAPKVKR